MERSPGQRLALTLVAGAGGPAAVAAALVPVRTSFAPPAAALILVALVLAVAVLGNRLAGAVAAVSSAAWFDFFLTSPYERFAISHLSDVETTVSLLLVGLFVTELAARNRQHHGASEERMDFVAVIYGLAELISTGASSAEVLDRARRELSGVLALRDCRFEAGTTLHLSTRIEHNAELVSRPVALGGEPASIALGVEHAGQSFGRFVLVPEPGSSLTAAQRLTAVAIADQVGAALAEERRSA
jgi:K+-sensing histidine kinase KdpD